MGLANEHVHLITTTPETSPTQQLFDSAPRAPEFTTKASSISDTLKTYFYVFINSSKIVIGENLAFKSTFFENILYAHKTSEKMLTL